MSKNNRKKGEKTKRLISDFQINYNKMSLVDLVYYRYLLNSVYSLLPCLTTLYLSICCYKRYYMHLLNEQQQKNFTEIFVTALNDNTSELDKLASPPGCFCWPASEPAGPSDWSWNASSSMSSSTSPGWILTYLATTETLHY